jgi:hypothetical protein
VLKSLNPRIVLAFYWIYYFIKNSCFVCWIPSPDGNGILLWWCSPQQIQRTAGIALYIIHHQVRS